MQTIQDILHRAQERKGGVEALDKLLGEGSHARDISTLTDDRLLSEFSLRIFQAGFNWSVVENKWDGFEAAFEGFDIGRNVFMSDDDFDVHLKDKSIVRHAAKILTVRDNAIFLSDLAKEHGTAARFFQDWPSHDLVGLWDVMKHRGKRLGGMTGQYALRFLGKDSFILSRSVVTALQRAGVIDGAATSKGARRKVQGAFNAWHDETGESYTRLSRILALSVND